MHPFHPPRPALKRCEFATITAGSAGSAGRRAGPRIAVAQVAALVVAVASFVGVAGAEPVPATAAPPTTTAPLVDVTWRGNLRLRSEWIASPGFGNGTTGLYRELSLVAAPHGGVVADRIGDADLRLRVEPTVHVGNWTTVGLQLDVANRVGLGEEALAATTTEQMTGVPTTGPVTQGFAVRRGWVDFDAFGVGHLRIGRMGDHFGLGLLRNDGRGADNDFQSDVDRVAIEVDLMGLRGLIARDNLATLPVIERGPGVDSSDLPLNDSTDVIRWVFQVESAAPRDDDGLHWGGAFAYQDQALGLAVEHLDDPLAVLGSQCVADGTCLQLVPRDATMVSPQVYLGWQRSLGIGRLRIEAEAALLYATVANTDVLAGTDTSKTFISGGAALKARLDQSRWSWLIDAGFASGESDGGFGVLDTTNFKTGDAGDASHRSLLTGFHFHRGYRVDGLLFRDLIGAVANAVYARIGWRSWLLRSGERTGLDLEAGLLGAIAASANATPGGSSFLGVEPELRLRWVGETGGIASLLFSWAQPGAAFDAGLGGATPSPAWRIAAEWRVGF